MILGLLSDTHGQAERAKRAVALLSEHGATAFIHCGDVCSAGVFDALSGSRSWFVWGNCDLPDELRSDALAVGLPVPSSVPLRLDLDGKRIAVFHGHEREFATVLRMMNGEAVAFDADYVFYGHTHVKSDVRSGKTRTINPGALHRAKPYTVATLDLQTDKLDFWQVN